MKPQDLNHQEEKRNENSKLEADALIRKLKTDRQFCNAFFFGKNPKKPNIARIRAKILRDILNKYHVSVSVDTFNTIVYLTLWSEGTWKVLDSYDGKSTFFAWLRSVARNAVMDRLEKEHWIAQRQGGTNSKRLTMLSQSEEKCKLVIDELMIGSEHYELLTNIFVKRLKSEDIMRKMNMEKKEYEETRKKAIMQLKDAIQRSTFFFESDILHDKVGRKIIVSSEFVADMEEWYKRKIGINPLSDVLGVNLSDDEVHGKTIDFLYDFSLRLKWNEQDRYIWLMRYIENQPPTAVAKNVGKSREWLDTRYCRLNKKFNKAIREWWQSYVLKERSGK